MLVASAAIYGTHYVLLRALKSVGGEPLPTVFVTFVRYQFLMLFAALLRGYGVALRSVTEPIDDSPAGRFMEGICAAMAQFDNDLKSDRTKVGMRAALERGTIAVVAGGVDVPYPPDHADLMARIAEQGLVIAEQPPGIEPQARHFPRRNRIIAGLSAGTIVVEGAPKSGSLITARIAADLGREVMAVPGSPLDPRAQGCYLLIREGATQKLQDAIVGGKAQGMQFMDDAIWAQLQQGHVSPHEAFMKAIDKNRFKAFLPEDEAALANSAGGAS